MTKVPQRFSFIGRSWNIDKVDQHVQRKKLQADSHIDPKKWWDAYGGMIRINHEHAMSDDVDLTKPVYMARVKNQVTKGEHFHFPIDGWHRIYKAVQKGVDQLPAIVVDGDSKKFESVDELFDEFMRTGNADLLDEGFMDLFKSGASKAVGFARRVAGAASGRPQRRIGASAELLPGPRLLGPGKEPALLAGHVSTSRHSAAAHAASRMLPPVSAKTAPQDHPINKELSDRGYRPQGEYHHPEGGHFSVWLQHGRNRRGDYRDYPAEEGGQFHVEHGETGHPTNNWFYFHPPDQHSANSGYRSGKHNTDRFQMEPHEHATLEHPENSADYDSHEAIHDVTHFKDHGGSGRDIKNSYWDDKPEHQKSASAIGKLADELDELKPENHHHGGRYMSSEEDDLRRHGWSHSHDDNHATHEKYEFASNPVSVYTHDSERDDRHDPLEGHEIHLQANGGWKHMHPDHYEPVATHHDGELGYYLKHGIQDTLGASIHNGRDEDEDFPDHTTPQYNMGSGHKGFDGKGEEEDDSKWSESVRKMVRMVAEGVSPHVALVSNAPSHSFPKLFENFEASELERQYGHNFTPEGKVNEFPVIDTGHGIRIHDIRVTPSRTDSYSLQLPHSHRSRVYVTKRADSAILHKAFQSAKGFFSGDPSAESPADMLAGASADPKAQNAIADMMAIRRPENNPHEAYRDLVLPHVFKHLGMTGHGKDGMPHAQWHVQAGCGGCPCSPGFILHKSDHPLATGHRIHVEVD